MRKPSDVHPAAAIFPMMSNGEYEKLREDIRKNGQQSPITYWCGKLLDGRNRLKACRELGIDPQEEELDESIVTDPCQWVISQNLHRRHLTNQQRAMIAARLATMKHGSNQHTKEETPSGVSIDDAAALLQVTPRSIDRAKFVVGNGSKDVVETVEQNVMPLATAEKLVKHVPDKREQSSLLKDGVKAVRDHIKQLATVEPPRKEKPSKARKSLPELVVAFRHSKNKASDLRVLIEDLDPSFKSLLIEWLK